MKYLFVIGRRYVVSTPKGSPVVIITALDHENLRLLERLKKLGNKIEATDLIPRPKATAT